MGGTVISMDAGPSEVERWVLLERPWYRGGGGSSQSRFPLPSRCNIYADAHLDLFGRATNLYCIKWGVDLDEQRPPAHPPSPMISMASAHRSSPRNRTCQVGVLETRPHRSEALISNKTP